MIDKKYIEYIDNYLKDFEPYKNGRWCYEDGILMTALYNLYLGTSNDKYFNFISLFYDNHIEEDGTIKNYDLEEFNIDNVASGIALIDVYLITKKEKYLKAINTLYKQLSLHPRTKERSFWHKKIYPNQVWMDGIYMGLVFYAKYAKLTNNNEIIEDIRNQLNVLEKRLYDKKRSLFVHAYDESKKMPWANKRNGKSANVWSRACGWVAMAMVDIYECSHLQECKRIYKKLVMGLFNHLSDGMLYQVVDKESYPNNYKETSGSSMLAYSLFKAKRLKMLDTNKGEEVFQAICDSYFKKDNIKYHLENICKVAGLDGTRRNGTIEYYLSEPIVRDEVKGVAPFILTISELIKKE